MSYSNSKMDAVLALSKQRRAHLFPKSERFSSPKPECPEAFYNTASLLDRRATHLGYGKKSDFTLKNTESPPSNKYQLLSPIGRERGRSFGCSREVAEKFSYINPELKFLPGPGEYEAGLSPRNLLSSQNKTIEAVDKKQPFPYSPGTYFVSKYRNTKYGTIDPNAKRFPEIKASPGPMDYHLDDIDRFQSGYVVSSYRGAGSRHFDKELRFTDSHWKLSENPGPGKYAV